MKKMPTVIFYYNEDGICESIFANMPVKFIHLKSNIKGHNKKNIIEVTMGSEKREVLRTFPSYIPAYEDWVETIVDEIKKQKRKKGLRNKQPSSV